MGNKEERYRQKKAYMHGFFSESILECKYKHGTATWNAWMRGFESGKEDRRNKRKATEAKR